jgi:hypothetical protein
MITGFRQIQETMQAKEIFAFDEGFAANDTELGIKEREKTFVQIA